VSTVAGSAVGIVWAIASPSVWALVAQSLATSAAGVVVLWSVSGYRPGLRANPKQARSLVDFGVNILGIRLAFFAGEYGDNFIIGLMLGPRALGFYVVGFRVFRIITEVVTSTLSAVTLPMFSRMQDDRDRLINAFLTVTRLSVTIAVPVFASGAVLAPYLIPALFGDRWRPSVEVMQILSLVGLVTCVASFDRSALIAVGRVRLELVIAVSSSLAAVAAFIIGAHWGIVGVAIAIVVRAYLFWPVRMLALRAATGMPLGIYFLQWLRPVACGAGAVLAMLGVGIIAPGPARFASELVTGPLVYAALLRVVAPAGFHEFVDTLRQALPSATRFRRASMAEGPPR
jgi:O-antigen/teichoic acid export membrane protein